VRARVSACACVCACVCVCVCACVCVLMPFTSWMSSEEVDELVGRSEPAVMI
jgi:hypothetical protein